MITEASQNFIDELIAEIGEPAAVQLLEEATAFRALRKAYLAGDAQAMEALVGTIAGWEESDDMPLFCSLFVPYVREMSLLKPAEAIAELQRGTPLGKQISDAVTLLRSLASGRMAIQLQTPVMKIN